MPIPSEFLVSDKCLGHLYLVVVVFFSFLFESQLEELQNQLFQRNNQLDIEQSKVKQLKNHMKNVQQEITYTNTLCNLRDKEINEELHQIKLIEREYERLIQENKKISQINSEIIEKKSFLEVCHLICNKRLCN